MAKIIKTDCSCGEIHEFGQEYKKFFSNGFPDYIECNECPICSPELFDNPEDHEDEAYRDDVDIEELEKALNDDPLEDIDELDENFDEEY
jgi:hypothetical protein